MKHIRNPSAVIPSALDYPVTLGRHALSTLAIRA